VTSESTSLPVVLPRFPEPDTQPFWEATARHELTYQVCEECGKVVFYPRRHCPHCTSLDLTWRVSKGTGTIYTFSVVRRSQHPAFAHMVPYVIGWIDVDEGFRMMSHVKNVDPDDPKSGLEIGARVRVHWIDHENVSLPAFELA
jgi:uncharacterized OB-fold protein